MCVGTVGVDDTVNWGININNWDLVTNDNTRSYLSLDGLEDYTKRMKEIIDKKVEVINERLKKLEDGGFDGKFGAVRGWMMCQ